MGKVSGLGDNFYYGGYDLSGTIASVDTISGASDVLEMTGIKEVAHERRLGARAGSWSFTTLFENNVGVSTPGVPLTTVPLVSPYNFPVLVTITGGTVTNVSINGATVGSGDGTYVLNPLVLGGANGTITLTYSVAPTWNWVAVPSEHQALSPLVRTDQVSNYFRGTAVGAPAAGMVCKQLDYDPTRDTTGNLTLKCDLQANAYGMEWGVMLTPGLRTDTAATVGSFFDNGSAGAFGAQAYLQLIELVGTSVDVTVTHSATSGGTYTTLFDFTALSSSNQAFRLATATNPLEFLKVVTAGTFTYAQFAVMIVKNQVAVAF